MALLARGAGELACSAPSAAGTGVEYIEAKTIIKDFCSFNNGAKLGASANITTIHKTTIGNSDLILTITRSATEKVSCSDGTGLEVAVTQSTCERAFYRLLDECNTSVRSSCKYGGSVASNCGVYTMSTIVEEIVRCGGNPWSRPADLPLDILSDGIDGYCGTSLDLTPDYIRNDRFLTGPRSGQSFDNFVKKGYVVKSVTQFNGQGQTDCAPSKPFNTKGEECRRKLRAISDQCGGQGGGLSENGANGCVLWTVWGQHAH